MLNSPGRRDHIFTLRNVNVLPSGEEVYGAASESEKRRVSRTPTKTAFGGSSGDPGSLRSASNRFASLLSAFTTKSVLDLPERRTRFPISSFAATYFSYEPCDSRCSGARLVKMRASRYRKRCRYWRAASELISTMACVHPAATACARKRWMKNRPGSVIL